MSDTRLFQPGLVKISHEAFATLLNEGVGHIGCQIFTNELIEWHTTGNWGDLIDEKNRLINMQALLGKGDKPAVTSFYHVSKSDFVFLTTHLKKNFTAITSPRDVQNRNYSYPLYPFSDLIHQVSKDSTRQKIKQGIYKKGWLEYKRMLQIESSSGMVAYAIVKRKRIMEALSLAAPTHDALIREIEEHLATCKEYVEHRNYRRQDEYIWMWLWNLRQLLAKADITFKDEKWKIRTLF